MECRCVRTPEVSGSGESACHLDLCRRADHSGDSEYVIHLSLIDYICVSGSHARNVLECVTSPFSASPRTHRDLQIRRSSPRALSLPDTDHRERSLHRAFEPEGRLFDRDVPRKHRQVPSAAPLSSSRSAQTDAVYDSILMDRTGPARTRRSSERAVLRDDAMRNETTDPCLRHSPSFEPLHPSCFALFASGAAPFAPAFDTLLFA